MADEEKKESGSSAPKRDFSQFHNMPVEEWSSHVGGSDYKSYLRSGKLSGSLDSDEKKDYDRLVEYEKSSPDKESEESYDESAIDWTRLETPYDVAFYLSYPSWILSKQNRNIQGYVKEQYKKKSMSEIAKEARKKLGKEESKATDKSQNKNENEDEQDKKPEEPPKKRTLWVRFVDFVRKSNNTADLASENNTKYGHEPLNEIKLSKSTEREIVKNAEDLLKKEGLTGEGLELGDE